MGNIFLLLAFAFPLVRCGKVLKGQTSRSQGRHQFTTSINKAFHPRSVHRNRYDFQALIKVAPDLAPMVFQNQYGDESVDWSRPEVVRCVNKALLFKFYNVTYWDFPPDYLTPGVPVRADYMHYLADLLKSSKLPLALSENSVRILDIGCGASCIYPLIGLATYKWHFSCSDVDDEALSAASNIIAKNSASDYIQLRKQINRRRIFDGIVEVGDFFTFSICNPPFHSSAKDAALASHRKWANLGRGDTKLPNFSGTDYELFCPGGEAEFVETMIRESILFKESVCWFTTLVSKGENIPKFTRLLESLKPDVKDVKIVEMDQGNKKSRILAWTFFDL